MSPELIVFFTAMIPFLEMKLSIPVGIEMGLSSTTTMLFSVAGSMIPPAIFLALVSPVSNYLRKKITYMDVFFEKLFTKTRKEHSKRFNRYGTIFLIALIAIPLPGSGTMSASLIAFVFGVDHWKALGIISLGAITSAILLTAGFNSIFAILDLFI